MTANPRGRTQETRELASGIDTGARAEMNTSCHHSLLIRRIAPERLVPRLSEAFMRGVNRGSRHLSGLVNWRRATVGLMPIAICYRRRRRALMRRARRVCLKRRAM